MRRKIVEYCIVCEDEPGLLEDAVMAQMESGADGWEPHGPMVAYVALDESTYLCQPMVRTEAAE